MNLRELYSLLVELLLDDNLTGKEKSDYLNLDATTHNIEYLKKLLSEKNA